MLYFSGDAYRPFLSPGQTIATSQRNISQQCWPSICKLQPNDCNIVWRNMLYAFGHPVLRHVASWKSYLRTCLRATLLHEPFSHDYNIMQHPQMLHEKFDHFQIWANNTQHVATCRNTRQQDGHTNATCCTQQHRDMLRWNVPLKCCDRLPGALQMLGQQCWVLIVRESGDFPKRSSEWKN